MCNDVVSDWMQQRQQFLPSMGNFDYSQGYTGSVSNTQAAAAQYDPSRNWANEEGYSTGCSEGNGDNEDLESSDEEGASAATPLISGMWCLVICILHVMLR